MSTNKNISIVIPVYNEADQLADCLDAIAALELPPFEVLVVDNNSTDGTAAVAGRYPFVTVLTETHQGVVYARNCGFDAARGQIIARIDADTLVTPNWTQHLQAAFADSSVTAVTGSIRYYDVALGHVVDKIDLQLRAWLARKMAPRIFLQGANMAMRRSAWRRVRPQLCSQSRIHEDLDLAIHLADRGEKIVYEPELVAGISGRRADTTARSFYAYVMQNPQTYKYHHATESRYMYAIIAIGLLYYVPLRILFRGFNSQTQQFDWRLVASSSSSARVNPATFIS